MSDNRKYTDRREYIIKAVAKRRKTVRQKAINYKGGKCAICGYKQCYQALDFHHIGRKRFGISAKGYTRSWESVKKELDQCILVCANCHREIEVGITQPPRETLAGKQGELRET